MISKMWILRFHRWVETSRSVRSMVLFHEPGKKNSRKNVRSQMTSLGFVILFLPVSPHQDLY